MIPRDGGTVFQTTRSGCPRRCPGEGSQAVGPRCVRAWSSPRRATRKRLRVRLAAALRSLTLGLEQIGGLNDDRRKILRQPKLCRLAHVLIVADVVGLEHKLEVAGPTQCPRKLAKLGFREGLPIEEKLEGPHPCSMTSADEYEVAPLWAPGQARHD